MKQNRGAVTETGTKRRKLISILKLIAAKTYVAELGTIKVNKNFEIIDGHHRLEALRIHQLPVRYEIIYDDKFNNTSGREKLGHMYDVNSINASWSQKDMYKGALVAKAPLALAIQALIVKHRDTFDFNHVIALLLKRENIFTGARKTDVNMQMFDNKNFVEYMQENEFDQEFKYFLALNQKLRISDKANLGFKAAYAIIWRYMGHKQPPVFRGSFRKAILATSENMLRNSERTRSFSAWVRLFIETYNKKNRDKIKVTHVLKELGKIE
jgi:hypothetical protein